MGITALPVSGNLLSPPITPKKRKKLTYSELFASFSPRLHRLDESPGSVEEDSLHYPSKSTEPVCNGLKDDTASISSSSRCKDGDEVFSHLTSGQYQYIRMITVNIQEKLVT